MANLPCSLSCGKSQSVVARLAAGPGGIHICDERVEARRLLMDGQATARRASDPAARPTDRLLTAIAPLSDTLKPHRRRLGKVVDALRAREVSWAKIAAPLGVSHQTAWERFG